jgi:hypothetical protein
MKVCSAGSMCCFKGLNVSNECYLKPHKMDCDNYVYFSLFGVADTVTKKY